MSFQAATSDFQSTTSPSQKLKNKQAASRIKLGSPKLRDLLRSKCRIRIKESRSESFNSKRYFTESEKSIVNNILREELAAFEKDIELQQLIYTEISNDLDEWFFEETLKADLENIAEYLDQTNVFCPVCQKHCVSMDNNVISCVCGLRIATEQNLGQFYTRIQGVINGHNDRCTSVEPSLLFFMEPKEEVNLFLLQALCCDCDTLFTVFQ